MSAEIESKKLLVVIGTSGSHDYLKDTTGRFWPVRVPVVPSGAPLSPEDRAVINKYLAASAEDDENGVRPDHEEEME